MTLAEMTKLDGEKCRAVAAVHALYALGLDDIAVQSLFERLKGTPVVEMQAMIDAAFDSPLEMRTTIVRNFAKRAKG